MFFFIWYIIISAFIMFFAIWDIVSSTYHYWIIGSSPWPAGTATMIALIVTLHSYSCPLGLAFISIISPILPAHRIVAATTWEKRESLESSSSKGRHSLRVLEVEEHCLHVFLQFFLIHGLHSGSFLSLQSLFCLSQYPDDTNAMYLQVYQFYERDISSLKAIIKLASGVDLLMMWYNMVFALNQIYNIFNISMCTVPLPWLLSALSSQSEN